MKVKWNSNWFFSAVLAGVALVAAGCAKSTTQDDVADARKDLREEQQETAETVRDAQQDVADARGDAQPYTVNKPVADEDTGEARQEVAEAQHEAKEEIRDQKQDEAEAAAEVRTKEQQLAATKARDQFVADTEKQLADIQAKIDQFKSSASNAEGATKENLDRQIDTLQNQHDGVEEALDNLKSAELAQWQAHRQEVRTAMQNLHQTMSSVR